jgi:hypothetical protein
LCHRRIALVAAGAIGLLGAAQCAWAQCASYIMTDGNGASIIPGATDIGLHADDGVLAIIPPFNISFYGVPYDTVYVSSNGNLQFGTSGTFPEAYRPECLPNPTQVTSPTIFAYWVDQGTTYPASGQGVFTATTGLSPNRQFVIEWRTQDCCSDGAPIYNYELVFNENAPGHFDIIYGALQDYSSAVIGVQNGTGGLFNQYSCFAPFSGNGFVLHFDCSPISPLDNDLHFNPVHGTVGASFLATSHVTPAASPSSTGITVVLDATGINAGTVFLHDDGLNGDVTANDNIYSAIITIGAGTAAGPYTLTAHAQDAQARTHDASATFTVAPPNDECAGAIPAVLGDNPFDSTWATASPNQLCVDLTGSDLWYTFSSPTDTGVVVSTSYNGDDCFKILVAYDDIDCTRAIACSYPGCELQFCAIANHEYKLRIGGLFGFAGAGTFNIATTNLSPTVTGITDPSCVDAGSSVTVMAVVFSDGCTPHPQTELSATADASSVGGSAAIALHDDGIAPDAFAGDGVWSGTATTAGAIPGGEYDLPVTVTFSGGPVSGLAPLRVDDPPDSTAALPPPA